MLLARAVRSLGHDIVGEPADGPSTIRIAQEAKADVLIIDSRLPDDTSDTIAHVREVAPQTAILVLANLYERDETRRAISAGARSRLLRPLRGRELAETLGLIARELAAG